jgi:GNAT superfamily N-acetyltransferase
MNTNKTKPFVTRVAGPSDAAVLTGLINLAFVVEKFFIDSDRVTLPEVEAFLRKGEFLVSEDAGKMTGCLYLERRGDRAYFGLLSIEPRHQGQGLGRLLIAAAEERARQFGCVHMDLQIVNLRTELPAFYRRLGYVESGTAPFPEGVATKLPCHFVRMSKIL